MEADSHTSDTRDDGQYNERATHTMCADPRNVGRVRVCVCVYVYVRALARPRVRVRG